MPKSSAAPVKSDSAVASRPGRPSKGAASHTDADTIVDVDAVARAAANLPVLSAQASEAMRAIGYDLAYDRERVVQEARFYMAQSAEAMLEAGRRLLVIKEYEPHGDFLSIVEDRLGLNVRAAQRMMAAAAKYLLNPKLEQKATALSLLGKTKLFELMAESDTDLAALADGGTLAGHTIDEIDAMTSRELKAALREARAEGEAKDQLLAEKGKRIDQLKAAQKRITKLPPDEAFAALGKEAAAVLADTLGAVRGGLRQTLLAIKNHGDEDHTPWMSGLVGQVQVELQALREEFGLPDISSAADLALAAEAREWGGA